MAAVALSPSQQELVDAVSRGENAFYTGAGGTGKTFVIRYLLEHVLKDRRKSVVVCSSTGITATAIGGVTFHSFAGLGIGPIVVPNAVRRASAKTKKNVKRCQVLLIDEVSMLGKEVFDGGSQVVAALKGQKDLPFGGMQVVMFGDLFQMPPVSDAHLCTKSQAWAQLNPRVVVADSSHNYRHGTDIKLRRQLDELRVGIVSEAVKEEMKAIRRPLAAIGGVLPTKLYCHRKNVDEENERHLKNLPGPSKVFVAKDELNTNLLNSCAAISRLELRVGAQVILVRNLDVSDGLCNGSRGIVVGFTRSSDLPIVKFANGEVKCIRRETFEVFDGEVVAARRVQIPLILGWAITIHKSQGMTLELVDADVSGAFEYGQVYTALSRARSYGSLSVKGFEPSRVRVHPEATEFYLQEAAKAKSKTKRVQEEHAVATSAKGGADETKRRKVAVESSGSSSLSSASSSSSRRETSRR